MDYQYHYQFKHIKTGKIIIAQSWSEFYDLQSNKDYAQTHSLLGRIVCHGKHDPESILQRQRMNKFWEGAKGFEKVSSIRCSSIPCSQMYNYIRNFLVNIHNHACMQGDIETVIKANEHDKWFYNNGNATRLLLTA